MTSVDVEQGPLSARLRLETRAAHDRLERALPLTSADLTLARFRDLVGRFYGFHAVWEPSVGAALGDDAFFDPRRKLALLIDDLEVLGVAPPRLPLCTDLPPLGSPAAAIGALYVMEGATLGGTIIARHLERSLGLVGGRGYSFFVSYGPRVGSMWQAFRARLATLAPRDADVVVDAAAACFAAFDRWLTAGAHR